LADARIKLPATMHSVSWKFWWRRNNGLGLFFMVLARPLVSVKGHFYVTAYNDILGDSVLPNLWQQFGEGPFLIQHDNAHVHKARSIQKWFVEIGVEELDWPAQRPDLNPIEHIWNELERRLRARPNCPTSVPISLVPTSLSNVPTSSGSLPRRVEVVIAAKGGPTPY
jgi:hypothetical protein